MVIDINGMECIFKTISKWESDGDAYFKQFYRKGVKRWNYRIQVIINGSVLKFTWHDSVHEWMHGNNIMTKEKYVTAFYCALSDAISYEQNPTLEDFKDEFGYDSENYTAINVFKSCKELFDQFREVFDIQYMYEIINNMGEYDYV